MNYSLEKTIKKRVVELHACVQDALNTVFKAKLSRLTPFSLGFSALEIRSRLISPPQYKDLKRARYKYTNKEYPWKVNAHLNRENSNEVIIDSVTSIYTYIGDTTSKGGAVSY